MFQQGHYQPLQIRQDHIGAGIEFFGDGTAQLPQRFVARFQQLPHPAADRIEAEISSAAKVQQDIITANLAGRHFAASTKSRVAFDSFPVAAKMYRATALTTSGQSTSDYPLRNYVRLSMAGVLNVLLLPPGCRLQGETDLAQVRGLRGATDTEANLSDML